MHILDKYPRKPMTRDRSTDRPKRPKRHRLRPKKTKNPVTLYMCSITCKRHIYINVICSYIVYTMPTYTYPYICIYIYIHIYAQ